MTLVYHGTPITPQAEFLKLAGRNFCISYFNRSKVSMPVAEGIASSLMLDNGAYSAWKAKTEFTDDYWRGYHEWCDPLLDRPTTWAVIPDAILQGSQEQERLVKQWPHGEKGAPVFHLYADFMHPLDRLLRLLDSWPRVCIGWAHDPREYEIGCPMFERSMDAVWNAIVQRHRRTPNVHMFRGTRLVRSPWPFASVDSTDVARNHNRPQNTAREMADRWDAAQCPARWTARHPQPDFLEGAAQVPGEQDRGAETAVPLA